MTELEIATAAGPAIAELDRPRGARALIVLTHGAGAGVGTVDLVAVRDAAVAADYAVALVTQPYRAAGRRTPPKPAPQDAAWLEIVAALRARTALRDLPLLVGGRSNGARVACRTAAASGAVGVVALAFPLHPPPRATPSHAGGPLFGRPEKSRLDELAGVGVPVLVVQGDRDPFGLPSRARNRKVVVIPGADHGLKKAPEAVGAAVITFVTSLLARASV